MRLHGNLRYLCFGLCKPPTHPFPRTHRKTGLATSPVVGPSTSTAKAAAGAAPTIEEQEEGATTEALPLALSAAFEGAAAGAAAEVKGLIPTLLLVEEGLRAAWTVYGTLVRRLKIYD